MACPANMHAKEDAFLLLYNVVRMRLFKTMVSYFAYITLHKQAGKSHRTHHTAMSSIRCCPRRNGTPCSLAPPLWRPIATPHNEGVQIIATRIKHGASLSSLLVHQLLRLLHGICRVQDAMSHLRLVASAGGNKDAPSPIMLFPEVQMRSLREAALVTQVHDSLSLALRLFLGWNCLEQAGLTTEKIVARLQLQETVGNS